MCVDAMHCDVLCCNMPNIIRVCVFMCVRVSVCVCVYVCVCMSAPHSRVCEPACECLYMYVYVHLGALHGCAG